MKLSMSPISSVVSLGIIFLISTTHSIPIFSFTSEDDSVANLEKKLRENEPGFKDFSKDTRLELAKIIRETIKTSTEFMKLNAQDLVQFSAFLTECTSIVNGAIDAKIPTCDSGVQKWIAEVGQFFTENEDDINRLIYPDNLPDDIQVILDVSNVSSNNDSSFVSEHLQTGSNYMTYLGQMSSKCDSLFDSYDSTAYSICAPAIKGLNGHLKSFFANSTSEVIQILGTDSP